MFKYCTATIDRVVDPAHKVSANDGIFAWTEDALSYPPGSLLVRTRAISARVNQNYDAWPSSELKRAYKTFIGKPVFVNHENYDHNRTRGMIVDSRWHEVEDDKFVELVIAVDQKTYPTLASEIKCGNLDSVSMGASVDETQCSVPSCAKVASDASDFCDHVAYMKGTNVFDEFGQSHLVYEICKTGVSFFEISFVFDPADETAVIQEVVNTKAAAKTAKTASAKPKGWAAVEMSDSNEWAIHNFDNNRTAGFVWQDTPDSIAEWSLVGSMQQGLTSTINDGIDKVADALGLQEIVKIPLQVDTLRQESICPQCKDDSFDGTKCSYCGYTEYLEGLAEPDTDEARNKRLEEETRQDENADDIEDGSVDPDDPDAIESADEDPEASPFGDDQPADDEDPEAEPQADTDQDEEEDPEDEEDDFPFNKKKKDDKDNKSALRAYARHMAFRT